MDALDLVQFYWHDYGVEKYVGAAQRLQVLRGLTTPPLWSALLVGAIVVVLCPDPTSGI